MASRRLTVLAVGTSSLVVFGLLRWRARKRARVAAEQAEKMIADGAMVRHRRSICLCKIFTPPLIAANTLFTVPSDKTQGGLRERSDEAGNT